MSPIRVLLIDDNSKFLDAATYFLSTEPRLEVVGCAPSGNQGLQEALRLQPDLVLLDVALPDINGLEVAHHLKTQANAACVVMMSLYHTSEYSDIARVLGVEACICKSEFGTRLLPLIGTLFDF